MQMVAFVNTVIIEAALTRLIAERHLTHHCRHAIARYLKINRLYSKLIMSIFLLIVAAL